MAPVAATTKSGSGAWAKKVPARVLTASVLAASLAFAGEPGPPALGPRLGPASAAVNFLYFTGALDGTAHIVPAHDCYRALPEGVTMHFGGKLRGSPAREWTVQVVAAENGDYHLPEGENAGVVVSSSPQDEVWGTNSNGSLTVDGARGSVNAELWDARGRPVHLRGHWDCFGE